MITFLALIVVRFNQQFWESTVNNEYFVMKNITYVNNFLLPNTK